MSVQNKTAFLGMLAVGLFIGAYFPVWKILAAKWIDSPEYSHAFLTLPIILYMVWEKKDSLSALPSNSLFPGLVLVGASTLLYLFSLLTQVDTFIEISMYVTILGTLIYLAGVQSIKTLFTPLLLLFMLIPVPDQLYPQLTVPLQLQVSRITEAFVSLFGIPLLREGSIMHLATHSFEVVAACSGLRSLITLLTLSVILGYFTLTKTTHKILLVAASIPTAIFVNVVRVSVMIILYHYFALDLTEGVWHTVTGLLVFGLALGTLLMLQKIMQRWEQ